MMMMILIMVYLKSVIRWLFSAYKYNFNLIIKTDWMI